jgi:multidrug efflux pump subunit AcrB
VIPGIDVDVYESLISALFFAIFMTPVLYVLRRRRNKK